MSSVKKSMGLYALFDKKLAAYVNVKEYGSLVEMARDYEMFIANADKRLYIANHLDEYAVYHIGYFDTETGDLEKIPSVCVLELSSLSKE